MAGTRHDAGRELLSLRSILEKFSMVFEIGSGADVTPDRGFREDVLRGLTSHPKSLPPKHLYDRRGSELFDQICELEEYYPTRTELAIMEKFAGEMADAIGSRRLVLELGSGSSLKTRRLLEALESPAAYVPFDISFSALAEATEGLRFEFPDLDIIPFCGDFTESISLPAEIPRGEGTLVYFPGSTIGNLLPENALLMLKRIRGICTGGGLLLGIDLQKEVGVLERAYNDEQGTTAAFNLNLLARINRELQGTFDLDQFEHRAVYNEEGGRIEMHLLSRIRQSVQVAGQEFSFDSGESICTEYSHKFTMEGISSLAREAGLSREGLWTDEKSWFAVLYLVPDRGVGDEQPGAGAG